VRAAGDSGGGRAKLGSAVTPRAPGEADSPPATTPQAPAAEPPSAAPPPAAPSPTAPNERALSPAELQDAFAEAKVKALTKALFAAGRFVSDSDGATVLALPNAPHRDRCEPLRAEVEAALADVLGQPVTLQLVVQETPKRPPRPTADETVDPAELVDAPPGQDDGPVARLTRAFPGSELVEDS
jgi:hypothetical protein